MNFPKTGQKRAVVGGFTIALLLLRKRTICNGEKSQGTCDIMLVHETITYIAAADFMAQQDQGQIESSP
ncbi:hypothetical protein D7Y24_10185 [Stenotrophomonas maltophilia]|nr:hypothetical protein [Stenotrophomonas maltophilia]